MKKDVPTYQTDALMKDVFKALSSDMKSCLGFTGRMQYSEDAIDSRTRTLLLPDNISAYTYKWCAQMSGFLKRYTFENDPITPAEREEVTNVKFVKLQESLAKNYWGRRSLRLHEVLRRARSHSRRILSGFSPEDLHDHGQFGTKATVGCPKSHAYIDEKLVSRSITGSSLHTQWFTKDYLAGDVLLASIVKDSKFELCDMLSQVNVRKKWNIDRGINPNTLIGSLHSSALGRIVEKALCKEGLDIRKLQMRHSNMIQRASIKQFQTGGKIPFVTADLTNASHGFLSHHLNALLPREWYRACMTGVIRQVEVGQQCLRLESIMTMGIGFTFPMQTLLFYCLLCALRDLLNIKGVISVYGDDLIYPRRLHPYVVAIFSEMGFQLNLDKTFVSSPFRESCGSDWFHGVDVRPFSPEAQSASLGRVAFSAFCYKLINGFLRRWHEEEIPNVLRCIKFHICDALGSLFYVPMNYSDFSGIKVNNPDSYINGPDHQYLLPTSPSVAHCGPGTSYRKEYTHIQAKPRKRYVTHHAPYYWDWLRSRGTTPEDVVHRENQVIESTPIFQWSKRKHDRTMVSCRDGMRRRRKHAYVARKEVDDVTPYELIFASVCSQHAEEK